MITTLAIAVGVVIGAGLLYGLSLLGRTVVEPYTLTSELDESWLDGDFPDAGAGTDDGACANSVKQGHTESFPDFEARITRDRMNRSAREARERFNRQGDPQ